jgi:membrane protease YdiL (CAAX protease family)
MNKFFLINNADEIYSSDRIIIKIKYLVLSFVFMFLSIILSLIIVLPLNYLITDYFHFESILELISKTQSKYHGFFLLIVIIGPIVEELIFRLVLKVSKFNLAVFVSVISYKFIGGQISKFNSQDINSYLHVLFGIAIGLLIYFYTKDKFVDFLNKNQKWLVLISILSFGFAHINNIKIYHWELILFYPFFVLPQFILGYFSANLRLKYGFIWGFFLHALLNGFTLLI